MIFRLLGWWVVERLSAVEDQNPTHSFHDRPTADALGTTRHRPVSLVLPTVERTAEKTVFHAAVAKPCAHVRAVRVQGANLPFGPIKDNLVLTDPGGLNLSLWQFGAGSHQIP